jgi:hypothetical protein
MMSSKMSFKEQMRFLYPFFLLMFSIWALRIMLDAAGAPGWLTRLMSLTTFSPIAILLGVLLLHVRGAGGYSQVVVTSFLINAWAQLLIIATIVFSVTTGIDTVYTAPEFSLPGDDPWHMRHIHGHLTFGIGLGSLVGAGVGCLLLSLLRRFIPLQGGK